MSRMWRIVWLAALLAARSALAHSFEPAVLALQERGSGVFDVVWKMPGPESGLVTESDYSLRPGFPAHCRLLDQMDDRGSNDEQPVHRRVSCGAAGLRGQRLTVDGLNGSRLDVIVRVTFADGETMSGVLRSGATEWIVPAAQQAAGLRGGAPAVVVLWGYLRLGVEHILLGYDHLSFVLALMLLVPTLGKLVKTISAFTIAHSLTLALALLGVVHVPPAPVEALIAMSIALVALELTRGPTAAEPTLSRQYPWAVAFIFGLLHGLGFAGALTQIGLPPEQIPLALVGFNVGVEIGQLLFVLTMLGPVALSTRITTRWAPARLVPAYAIGALAVAWTIGRLQRFWM